MSTAAPLLLLLERWIYGSITLFAIDSLTKVKIEQANEMKNRNHRHRRNRNYDHNSKWSTGEWHMMEEVAFFLISCVLMRRVHVLSWALHSVSVCSIRRCAKTKIKTKKTSQSALNRNRKVWFCMHIYGWRSYYIHSTEEKTSPVENIPFSH